MANTTATTKVTKRMVINAMLNDENIVSNADFKAYLENELALLDRKASNKKATKTQEENVGIKDVILATLENVKSATVTEMQNANDELKALSNQKVSALVRQLVESGKVTKTVDKKKSYFSLA